MAYVSPRSMPNKQCPKNYYLRKKKIVGVQAATMRGRREELISFDMPCSNLSPLVNLGIVKHANII